MVIDYTITVGNLVEITSVVPSGYNGTYTILTVSGNSFTYTDPTSGLASSSNIGTATPVNQTTGPDPYLFIDTTTVQTTVTVPDGGTVLLGGVKQLNEQRLEYGVPVLSKIPWLDRLFRNVGIGRVSTSLMLMVTPRIIILEEEEEKLGVPTTAL